MIGGEDNKELVALGVVVGRLVEGTWGVVVGMVVDREPVGKVAFHIRMTVHKRKVDRHFDSHL